MTKLYSDRHWRSADQLKLHFRDYPARGEGGGADNVSQRLPVVCLHGLTRNARDFAELADHISATRRVIVPEVRGRGESEYAPESATYTPLIYVQDLLALLEQEGISQFISVGTSMGGLMTMILAAQQPGMVAAAVLNDIGPEIDPAGLERIADYVGQGRSYPTWMHAARSMQETHGPAFPKYSLEDWLAMAKRTLVLSQNGRVVFDYDMAIADPFRAADGAAPPDLWPAYAALSSVPVLIIRGALSDLLTTATVDRMLADNPHATAITVPDVGHAPMLDEAESRTAIDLFLKDLA